MGIEFLGFKCRMFVLRLRDCIVYGILHCLHVLEGNRQDEPTIMKSRSFAAQIFRTRYAAFFLLMGIYLAT